MKRFSVSCLIILFIWCWHEKWSHSWCLSSLFDVGLLNVSISLQNIHQSHSAHHHLLTACLQLLDFSAPVSPDHSLLHNPAVLLWFRSGALSYSQTEICGLVPSLRRQPLLTGEGCWHQWVLFHLYLFSEWIQWQVKWMHWLSLHPVCRCQGARTSKLMLEEGVQIPGSQSNRAGQNPHSLQEVKHLSVQIPQHTLSVHASTDRITKVSSFIFQLSWFFSPRSSWKMCNTPSVSLTVSVWQRTHSWLFQF